MRRRRADRGAMTTSDCEENEACVVFAERWLDEQFDWAMQQKQLHADNGPWRRGAGTPEERLSDARHHLQQALILYDDCQEGERKLRAEVRRLNWLLQD